MAIPDNWDGDLVILCRGYSHLLSGYSLQATLDRNTWVTDRGFAFAATDYGEGGFCINKAMIRVHQLTEYLINNYAVTGKVFLMGVSMGSAVSMLLGTKYSNLYDGVIEISGPMDIAANYVTKMRYVGITDDTELGNALVADGCLLPPFPSPTIAAFRQFCLDITTDMAIECGGTPDTKPQKYERISPIYSATDIKVPTITVHGTADAYVPYSQPLAFYNTVNDEGNGDLYRLYKVVNAKHVDGPVNAELRLRFDQLVTWVNDGVAAPTSIP